MGPNANQRSDPTPRHTLKILALTAYFLFMFSLPFMPLIFPDSHLVQLFLGNDRFMLVWILMILLAFPAARREMQQHRRADSHRDQERGN